MKNIMYIRDSLFSHVKYSSLVDSELFDWVRKYDEDFLIFTDGNLYEVTHYNNQNKYAWLLESPVITPMSYDYIKTNHNHFKKIFTFDKNLLEISDKFILTPVGGCWINKQDWLVHKKDRNLSIILSNKKGTEGQNLRHMVIEKFNDIDIDVYGFNNPIGNKITALKNYRYSIIIENCKQDYYFTEKLIDCLITGTVPIYWGCPSIGDFFDINGIIVFDNINQLDDIINDLTEEKYNSMITSIKNNFELSKKYVICDDLIFNYLKNDEKILG